MNPAKRSKVNATVCILNLGLFINNIVLTCIHFNWGSLLSGIVNFIVFVGLYEIGRPDRHEVNVRQNLLNKIRMLFNFTISIKDRIKISYFKVKHKLTYKKPKTINIFE